MTSRGKNFHNVDEECIETLPIQHLKLMKTIYLALINLLFSITPSLADHPYFPFKEKREIVFTYLDGAAGGAISKFVSKQTGETKEIDGKSYSITKNWLLNKEGKKVYPNDSFARVDKEGNVYSINPGLKTEALALPAVSKLKKGYIWTTELGVTQVTNKVISVDGKITLKDFKMEELLVIEQTIGEDTKMKSYFKKGLGPVAVATISKENEEKFMFHLKQ